MLRQSAEPGPDILEPFQNDIVTSSRRRCARIRYRYQFRDMLEQIERRAEWEREQERRNDEIFIR
jgi:hypothetical protein